MYEEDEERCGYHLIEGVRVWIPGCMAGAVTGGEQCTCPPRERKKRPDSRIEELTIQVGDLSMLVRRLVHQLGPENVVSKQANDYLARHDLKHSPLREGKGSGNSSN